MIVSFVDLFGTILFSNMFGNFTKIFKNFTKRTKKQKTCSKVLTFKKNLLQRFKHYETYK